MVPGMEPQAAKDALRTQITDAACITIHAALDAPLKFKADGVDAVMVELMPDSYETLRKAFDDLRYGGFVRTPLIGLGSLSQFDPSRVPEGKAILHAWDYAPYERPDGSSWDRRQARLCRHHDPPHVRFHRQYGRDPGSPYRQPGRHGAHQPQLHAAATLHGRRHHHLSVRRAPTDTELGQYRVPGVDRLYLVGPFQHPGGGVFGAGRATAQVLLDDLGVDFDRVRV